MALERTESEKEKPIPVTEETADTFNQTEKRKREAHPNEGSEKRQKYLSWNEYFMALAFISAERSKDPRTQVGACIVNQQNRIVGIGYNGMPNGIKDEDLSWERKKKKLYVCHAEMNCILNKLSADIRGCTMYCTLYPCSNCTKMIIQSGIKHLYYYTKKDDEDHKEENKASADMLMMAKVEVSQYKDTGKMLQIDGIEKKL